VTPLGPVLAVGGRLYMTIKLIRDLVIIGVGTACILSQVVYQFVENGPPNFPVMAIGASLLAGYPLVRLGDHQGTKEP
jgi:hypothetical protein